MAIVPYAHYSRGYGLLGFVSNLRPIDSKIPPGFFFKYLVPFSVSIPPLLIDLEVVAENHFCDRILNQLPANDVEGLKGSVGLTQYFSTSIKAFRKQASELTKKPSETPKVITGITQWLFIMISMCCFCPTTTELSPVGIRFVLRIINQYFIKNEISKKQFEWIQEVLNQLLEPEFVAFFSNTKTVDFSLAYLVRLELQLNNNQEITGGLIKFALLKALLSPMTQGEAPNCFAFVAAKLKRKLSPRAFLEDIDAILRSGTLDVYGAPVPADIFIEEDLGFYPNLLNLMLTKHLKHSVELCTGVSKKFGLTSKTYRQYVCAALESPLIKLLLMRYELMGKNPLTPIKIGFEKYQPKYIMINAIRSLMEKHPKREQDAVIDTLQKMIFCIRDAINQQRTILAYQFKGRLKKIYKIKDVEVFFEHFITTLNGVVPESKIRWLRKKFDRNFVESLLCKFLTAPLDKSKPQDDLVLQLYGGFLNPLLIAIGVKQVENKDNTNKTFFEKSGTVGLILTITDHFAALDTCEEIRRQPDWDKLKDFFQLSHSIKVATNDASYSNFGIVQVGATSTLYRVLPEVMTDLGLPAFDSSVLRFKKRLQGILSRKREYHRFDFTARIVKELAFSCFNIALFYEDISCVLRQHLKLPPCICIGSMNFLDYRWGFERGVEEALHLSLENEDLSSQVISARLGKSEVVCSKFFGITAHVID